MINKIRRFKIKYLLKLYSDVKRAEYFRKKKILHKVGENCKFTTTDFGNEPYLISIHNNVEIASNVRFITHDNSCFLISKYLNRKDRLDKVGSIEIFDNCFIGAYSILLPNIKIGPNDIVAAGSVVTKDVKEGEIVGGNPAKKIGTIDKYCEKLEEVNKDYTWNVNLEERDIILQKRKDFFWGSDK